MIKILLKVNNFFKVKYPNFKQFFNFCFVGSVTAVVDFGLTFLLKDVFSLNQYFSNTTALVTAMVTKFFWHRYWVFKEEADSNKAAEHKKFIKFVTVSTSGIGINNLIIYLLTFFDFGATWWFWASKVVATALVMIWNYFANKFWTFKRHHHEEEKL